MKKSLCFDRLLISLEFFGVTDGARTHDNRNHNPGLYQLSYGHHCLHSRQQSPKELHIIQNFHAAGK
jgi:hypothetical protein